MKSIRESDVEDYLKAQVKAAGGIQRKLSWIGRRGAPDRVVFFHGVYLVELKRPGAKPRPEQVREHEAIRRMGADITVISTKGEVDEFIRKITGSKDPT